MSEFASRAMALAPRISADPGDPEVLTELERLRALWRSMSAAERVDGSAGAQALAAARLVPAAQRATEEAQARRALSGLDRIDVTTAVERIYEGELDPDALLAYFGLDEFRAGQRDAVVAALRGRDSLVVMPTGGGKSLCYQLPGIATADLTVVVSPLIALMADQYRRLREGGHPVAMIASGMEAETAARALADVRSGRARIVLCSPERFGSSAFLEAVAERRVDLFAVDEAHCVSEWGHDFRPDYLRLRGVIDRLGSPAVMACTATATEAVGREISERLGLRNPYTLRAGFDRPNLSFDVLALEGTGSKARKQRLLSLALADAGSRPAIVYCGTRREVEEVSDQLRTEGLLAVGYHAGMPADERASAQHRFMAGDAEIVVATNAFGMGVDKADVRTVVHWSIPKSVEAYYQEVGRAGRDGRPSRAILLSSRADLGRLINFIKAGAVQTAGVATTGREARERAWSAYHAVEAFSSSAGSCRRRTLLDHFADASEGAPSGRCCDVCDPDTIGLPDPASLTPSRARTSSRSGASSRAGGAAALDPAALGLLNALRAWRTRASGGKPAYTVAHNSTLETIATRRPSSAAELARIKGVGPAFVERHGAEVLALVLRDGRSVQGIDG